MNKKQLLQTMFAMCTGALLATGCNNEEMTQPNQGSGTDEATSVTFSLGLPQGDEVGYTRADVIQDASENTLKSLKVYHFHATVTSSEDEPADAAYTLERIYNVTIKASAANGGETTTTAGTCINNGDGTYSVKLSLRTDKIADTDKHAFAFVANDSCTTFNTTAEVGTTTLEALHKQLADKKVTGGTASPALFMGDPAGLCMTGEVKNKKLTSGSNSISATESKTPLTRIMARLDVKNFVPQDRDFQIKSIRLLYTNNYTAPQGYLFGMDGQTFIWNTPTAATMEITQNAVYDTYGYLPLASYTAESGMKDTWVAAIKSSNGRDGVWYKKILYMYEYPAKKSNDDKINPIQIEVNYTLNGVSAKTTVKIEDEKLTPIAINRNYVYILQVGETEAQGGELTFKFVFAPWTVNDIDVDLSEGTEVTETPAS